MSDLCSAIRNLPLSDGWPKGITPFEEPYKTGHRDARHAAAELASEYAASHQRLKEALLRITHGIEHNCIADSDLLFAGTALRSAP